MSDDKGGTDMNETDEPPTTLRMRAKRAVRESSSPTWYEAVMGMVLISVAVVIGYDLTRHDPTQHSHAMQWTFVGIVGTVGLWLLAPVRAERLWGEAREVLPFLPAPKQRRD